MKTESFKSISESVKRIMLGEAPEAPEADIDAMAADAAAPEAEAPETEVEAPEAEEPEAPKKKGKGKLKYAAVCNKDGEEGTVLLSKEDLEDFIHDNGTKCITALYELGKETKVPTVKVKV
jgi:hypothetical protein